VPNILKLSGIEQGKFSYYEKRKKIKWVTFVVCVSVWSTVRIDSENILIDESAENVGNLFLGWWIRKLYPIFLQSVQDGASLLCAAGLSVFELAQ